MDVSAPPSYIPSKNILDAFDKKSLEELFYHKWPVSLGTVGPYLPTFPGRAHPVAQPTCRPLLAVPTCSSPLQHISAPFSGQ